MTEPQLTVVVPTRDRPESLARCLAALAAQSLSDALEIVVVDDGSTRVREVAEVVAGVPGARLLRTGPRGVAAARNAGALAARTPLVCITDDDCLPRPDWAACLRDALADGADAAAGPTLNGRPGDPLAVATQTIVGFLTERSLGPFSSARFAPGSNLAATAATLAAVQFDERYGPGGEDRDWCARLLATGRSIRWKPDAVVLHDQELTLSSFLRKHVNWGRGARQLRRSQPGWAATPPRFHTALVRRGFEHDLRTGLYVLVAQLATAAGYVDELRREAPAGTSGPRAR